MRLATSCGASTSNRWPLFRGNCIFIATIFQNLSALTAALSWGFRVMELNRIEAQVHPNNERSIGLLKRLGFVEEGRLRQAALWGNQYHDMLQYSLLEDEWRGDSASP